MIRVDPYAENFLIAEQETGLTSHKEFIRARLTGRRKDIHQGGVFGDGEGCRDKEEKESRRDRSET